MNKCTQPNLLKYNGLAEEAKKPENSNRRKRCFAERVPSLIILVKEGSCDLASLAAWLLKP